MTCHTVNGGLVEVDRAERWNEAEVETQPDTTTVYGSPAGGGWGPIGTEPNPLAGLPMLSIWVDK
ncbi:hypothetical protein, partial [Nocardioides sp.]|uniref:hypothetical protein n=1 Tax=Nocardioides sp. TaxID=35761 RepID=UPI0027357BE6